MSSAWEEVEKSLNSAKSQIDLAQTKLLTARVYGTNQKMGDRQVAAYEEARARLQDAVDSIQSVAGALDMVIDFLENGAQ